MIEVHTESSFIGSQVDDAIERLQMSERERQRRAGIERIELDPMRADDAPGGWTVLPSWIACDPSLSTEARVVLLVLSAHSDDRSHPFPSIGFP